MKIAVEGCCHGELDVIYETLGHLEKKNNVKVDLLLICGDFQSVRNNADMDCMAIPQNHRKMNSFYKYYSGEKTAPVLTIFIGGNHEASNYLQELPYGGWVAPKIFYMGYAGVVQFRGVRIGGISGIYKGRDYLKGHFEHPPYNEETKRSAYHVRNLEVFRLKQLQSHIDIFMSHDWPRGIHNYGNAVALVKRKVYFKEEVEKGILGSPVAAELLYFLKPSYWFAAHLHVKFPALVQHSVDDESKVTKFLALDKCLPRRQFLQVLDVPHDPDKPAGLQLDPEWLVILKLTNHLLDLTKRNNYPGPTPGGRENFRPTEEDIKHVTDEFGGDFSIPENFQKTAKAYDSRLSKKQNKQGGPAQTEINPQTTLICSMLDLTDPNAVFLGRDSTYQLGDDDDNDTQELDQDDEDKVDDVEDDESEQSFILSESDRSQSLMSASNDSLLSAGNDSFQSFGNDSILSAVNESFSSLGNPDEISINDDIDEENNVPVEKKDKLTTEAVSESNSNVEKLNKKGKRISIAERLAKCSELNKSNSTSSTTSEEEDLEFQAIMSAQKAKKESQTNDDLEFEAIMSAQKAKKSDDLDAPINKDSSDSSLDCKKLEISDEDAEFREMMKAQQESHETDNQRVMELSMDSEDIEFKEILKSQKEDQKVDSGSLQDIQKDFVNMRPTYQSSPLVSNEDRVEQSMAQKDLSPSHSGMKRGDAEKTNETPATKKFRRRNQDMYSDTSNSTGDESL